MTLRCIFLATDGLDRKIQQFRERHDPLANVIEPHITLVFPFDSDVSDDDLHNHILERLGNINPFEAKLAAAPAKDDTYIYYVLEKGQERIWQLHDQFYGGPLRKFQKSIPYIPHITLARIAPDDCDVIAKARVLKPKSDFRVSKLKLESIGAKGESLNIQEYQLGV